MKTYVRSAVCSEHRSEVTRTLAHPEVLTYDRWFQGLTPSQRRFILDLNGEGPAYGPEPDWIPLPEDIK